MSARYLAHHGGLAVAIMDVDDIECGIRAEINEVIVCYKLPTPSL